MRNFLLRASVKLSIINRRNQIYLIFVFKVGVKPTTLRESFNTKCIVAVFKLHNIGNNNKLITQKLHFNGKLVF